MNDELKDEFVLRINSSILNGELDEIIKEEITEEKEDLNLIFPGLIYQVTSDENQNNNEYNDTSNIKLGDCEKILKENYKTDELIIFKIDVKEEGLSIPSVTYQIYDLNKKLLLDTSLCSNTTLKVYLPTSGVDENHLEKYDPSSSFYNDICHSYSENGLDITNNDRKVDFKNKNLSLCGSNCEYEGYNITTKASECNCQYKNSLSTISEIIDNKDKLMKKFIDIKSSINIKLLKCSKDLFSIKGIKNNICSYINIIMLLFNIICLILLISKGYTRLIKMINNVVLTNDIIKVTSNNNDNLKKDKKKGIKEELTIKEPKNHKKRRKRRHSQKNRKENNTEIDSNKDRLAGEKKDKNDYIEELEKKKDEEYKITSIKNCNDSEINSLSYDEALRLDKRTFCQFYLSLIKRKQIIIFTFFTTNDYNLRTMKISLLILDFTTSYAVNALFFSDDTMHKIVEDEGKFNFLFQLPIILYSSLISFAISSLIQFLSLSEDNIIDIKQEKKDIKAKSIKIIKILLIKFIFFFILGFLLLFFYWFYLSSFCMVYNNTQLYLIKDTLINFITSCVYPFIFSLFPCFFRIISLRTERKNLKIIYSFSQILDIF